MQSPPVVHAEVSSSLVRFRIGIAGAFIPPVILALGAVYFFVGVQVLDLSALAVTGFIGLFLSSLFATNQNRFWDAAIAGVSSTTASTLFVLMLMVGLLSEMLKVTGVSSGFIWLSQVLNVPTGMYVAMTFLITCAIAFATGSSIGTMFAMFPILYVAGASLGADPALLAGAILSGAIFGDNLAPISDTTIISATTQRYRRRSGLAEVGGVVRSRLRYSIPAAIIATIGFALAGYLTASNAGANGAIESASPTGLWMLIAVAVLIVIAFWAKNLYLAIGSGLIVGTAIALVTGLIEPSGVIGADDGAAIGYLYTGLQGMLPLIGLLVAIFAMIGVIEASGVFDRIVNAILSKQGFRSARGSEVAMGTLGFVCTVIMAGINGPGIAFAGPLADKIGASAGLHPYRRSNIMDCWAMVGTIVPLVSSFLLIASVGTQGFEGVEPVSIFQILPTAFYPFALGLILVYATVTGYGRRYEGPNGTEVMEPDPEYHAEMTSTLPVLPSR